MNKDIIRNRFRKSINTYKQHAVVQERVCDNLCDKLSEINLPVVKKLFEIGCGTGFFTQRALSLFNPQYYFLNDLVSDLDEELNFLFNDTDYCTREFIPGDAEQLPYPDSMDMIISSSVFQWFGDLNEVFMKINTSLKKGGVLAFSTFGPDNYKEIRSVLGEGLQYLDLPLILDMMKNDFEILYSYKYEEKIYFDTPMDVLRHMKFTGVNGSNTKLWGRNKLNDFSNKYISSFQEENNKLGLTYNPILIIAKKR